MKYKTFPQVWKHKNGTIQIIYRNRIEIYTEKGITRYSKSEIDKENPDAGYDYEDIYGKGWNAHHEINMMKSNGFRRINDDGN